MRFSLGVNYWPRQSAMAMWRRFDPGEIREDFNRIAGLGLDAVRFFLRWDDFQPDPAQLDPVMLARLEAVADLAAEARLRTMPTLFCGHMSGVNWLPSWALDPQTPAGRFWTRAMPHRPLSPNRPQPLGGSIGVIPVALPYISLPLARNFGLDAASAHQATQHVTSPAASARQCPQSSLTYTHGFPPWGALLRTRQPGALSAGPGAGCADLRETRSGQ